MAAVCGGFPTNQSRPADRLGEALLDLVRDKKSNFLLRCSSVARATGFESVTANDTPLVRVQPPQRILDG